MNPDNKSQKQPQPLSLQARVDGICDQFEARLKAGDRPRIEEFLGALTGPEREALLRALLRVEIEYRGRQGEAVRREEYLGRFPADEALIQSLFDETRPPAAVPIASNGGPVLLLPGARPLPDYELIRKLGEGGFGEVWHASGPGGLDVALKFIRLDKSGGALEERSLEAMKRIRHPNLVTVFGAWHRGNLLILAMELCDRSLADRLKETLAQPQRGIPLKELLPYLRDAANGLDALNEQGVQHRDVKPANLLLLNKGVKVADFGLAKVLEATVASHTGACTPAYTTPESFRGEIAKQSDQYSLAMTYYHLRTGRLLFEGSLARLMHCHLSEQPTFAGLLPAEQAVVARALDKVPGQRWPNCKAFANELIKAYNAAQGRAAPPPKPEPPTAAYRDDLWSAEQRALLVQPAKQPATVQEAPQPAGRSRTVIVEPTQRIPAVKSRGRLWIGMGMALTILLLLTCVSALSFGGLLPNLFPAISTKTDSPGLPQGTGAKATKPDSTVPPSGTGPTTTKPASSPTPPLLTAPFTAKDAQDAQAAWAKHLNRKVVEVVDLGGATLELVLIPPGTFAMGSPKDEKERNPFQKEFDAEKRHTVTITKPFYLAKYPVTQEQYEKIVGTNPSWFQAGGKGKDDVKGLDTTRFPVETVSWDDADAFCAKAKNKVPWGKLVLPSEAQWEYACRAGTETPFYFGDVLDGNQSNCEGNYPYGTETKGPYLGRPCPVGGDKGKEYKPNNFGLSDMHGNVGQWCLDYYGPYDGLNKEDPAQLNKNTDVRRVLRGGSWGDGGGGCRAAGRSRAAADDRDLNVGFRVAVRLD